jgi:hypothetical protein
VSALDVRYTKRGHGQLVAYDPEVGVTWLLSGGTLVWATGRPAWDSLDGGHFAEEWEPVTEQIVEGLDDEVEEGGVAYLRRVREALESHP